MLFLLIISAPFDCLTFQSKLITNNNTPCDLAKSGDVGPIVTGIRELIRLPLHLSDTNLIQIFGHYSVGIGASIADVSYKNQNKSLLVNLDITNTFAHTLNNVSTSKTMLIIANNELVVYTYLMTKYMPTLYEKSLKKSVNQIIPSKIIPYGIIINQNIHEITIIQEYANEFIFDIKNDTPTGINRLFFHGIGIDFYHHNIAIFTLNKNLYGSLGFESKYFFIPVTNKKWRKHIKDNGAF